MLFVRAKKVSIIYTRDNFNGLRASGRVWNKIKSSTKSLPNNVKNWGQKYKNRQCEMFWGIFVTTA